MASLEQAKVLSSLLCTQQQRMVCYERHWNTSGHSLAPLVTTIPRSREDIIIPVKCSRVLIMLAVRLPGTWQAVYRSQENPYSQTSALPEQAHEQVMCLDQVRVDVSKIRQLINKAASLKSNNKWRQEGFKSASDWLSSQLLQNEWDANALPGPLTKDASSCTVFHLLVMT